MAACKIRDGCRKNSKTLWLPMIGFTCGSTFPLFSHDFATACLGFESILSSELVFVALLCR